MNNFFYHFTNVFNFLFWNSASLSKGGFLLCLYFPWGEVLVGGGVSLFSPGVSKTCGPTICSSHQVNWFSISSHCKNNLLQLFTQISKKSLIIYYLILSFLPQLIIDPMLIIMTIYTKSISLIIQSMTLISYHAYTFNVFHKITSY